MLHGAPFLRSSKILFRTPYLAEVLSDTCILYAYTSSSMPPAGSNYSRRIHVDCPRLIPGYWTNAGVMVALDDFTDENGVTEFHAALARADRAAERRRIRSRHYAHLSEGRRRHHFQRPHMAPRRRQPHRPAAPCGDHECLPLIHEAAL